MNGKNVILSVYKWLLISMVAVAMLGVLSLFFYNNENAAVIDMAFTIGVYCAISAIILWGFYYIVKAACIYIDKNGG